MKFKEEYKVREIAGENVIIKHGRFGVDMTRVIALNASSLLLWNKLQGRDFEVEDVAQILVDNYEIDQHTALADAAKWMERVQESGLAE